MTPTRLALLSPASGSRQCRASTDLGRGPHVSSSLHMHLPIPPLPSSFLSLSLPSFFYLSLSLSFLAIHLFHPFLLFLSSLNLFLPHTINKSTLEKTDKKLSASGGSPAPGKTGRHQHWRGWGATCVPPATPSTPPRRSSTVWSAHPSSPQRECRPVHLVLVMTLTRHRPMRAMRKQCPRQAWHSSWTHLHKGKLHFLKTDFLEVWYILRFFL